MVQNQITPNSAERSNTVINPPASPRRRPTKMPKIKPSVIALHAGIFALVITFVAAGYNGSQSASKATTVNNINATSNLEKTSVDDVVATSVAAVVAQSSNLPVAVSVANLAVSTKLISEFEQTSGANTTKPQIIGSSVENREVTSYTAQAGDTVTSLSTKFGISTQTIKWANNLTTDAISVGKVLRILPIDGILYDVKATDTFDSIATKYGVDKTRMIIYNDLEVSGLVPNTKIILPSANLPDNERPGYVAPVVINYFSSLGGFGGNTWFISRGTGSCPTYAYGNCTCYAYSRRQALGMIVGEHWGNANSWSYMASQSGVPVSKSPTVGAIMQSGGGWFGHVAIVESILENGDLSISEMNASVAGGGWNIVSGRIVPAGNVNQYNYIH